MTLPFVAIILGLALLVWSADRFVSGASSVAKYFGVPSLMIGMVIIGFGTSAPEMVVSALAAAQGNPGLAIGNGYGSNIANIALILGLTALIKPIAVDSQVIRKELPILAAVTALAAFQMHDGELTFIESIILLGVFAAVMGWTIRQGLGKKSDTLGDDVDRNLEDAPASIGKAVFRLIIGLILLVLSSRVLVWGAVEIAKGFGVSDLIIGLTIVAIGTSLPELAASLLAIQKGEHDLALGNVVGSNLFNTLAVVGIAGTINPTPVEQEVFYRDIPVMAALTLSLFVIGYGFKGPSRINRLEGAALLACFIGYTGYLIANVIKG